MTSSPRLFRKPPSLLCENGHVFHTAFPASYTGQPCPTCGKPLRRPT